jgi:hypothetical protein
MFVKNNPDQSMAPKNQRNTEYGSKTAKFVYFLKVCSYLRTVRADLALG